MPLAAHHRRSSREFALLAVVALALVGVWWMARIRVPIARPAITNLNFDDYAYYVPTFRYAFDQLRAGSIPHWNPYQHAGSPFFATAQHTLFYPLSLTYLVLPFFRALELTSILHLALALLAASVLGRTLGLGWPASLVTGIAFAFAPAFANLIFVPHDLYAFPWLPLELAAVHRMAERPRELRWPVLLGVVVAIQYLGGYPMYCLASVYAIAVAFAWRAAVAWRRGTPPLPLVGGLVLAAVVAAAFSAPLLLPAAELAQASTRELGGLSLAQAAPVEARLRPDLAALRTLLPVWGVSGMTLTPYVGLPALLLAVAAVVRRRESVVWEFLAIALLSWLVGLGQWTPLYELAFHLPWWSAFRLPHRIFPVAVLGLAVLAGFGTETLVGRPALRRTSAVAWLLVLGGGLLAAGWALAPDARVAIDRWFRTISPHDVPLSTGLGLLAVQGLVVGLFLLAYCAFEPSGRRRLVWLVPAGVFVALCGSTYNRDALPEMYPDLLTMPPSAVDFLRRSQGLHRTHVVWPVAFLDSRTPSVPLRLGLTYGLYQVSDRENVYPARFAQYADRTMPPGLRFAMARLLARAGQPADMGPPQGQFPATADTANLHLLDLIGIRFVVEDKREKFHQARVPWRFPLVFDQDGVRIYESHLALPRAFVVHRFDLAASAAQALDRVAVESFNAKTTVVLEGPPGIALPASPPSPPAEAAIRRYEPDTVVVAVTTSAPGILVLTDENYPGWEATVDGKAAPVLTADYLFRAVALPAGEHEVVFRFVPHAFHRGVVVAVAAVVLLGMLAAVRRRRPRGAPERATGAVADRPAAGRACRGRPSR